MAFQPSGAEGREEIYDLNISGSWAAESSIPAD
jgi:hypothetical protein